MELELILIFFFFYLLICYLMYNLLRWYFEVCYD